MAVDYSKRRLFSTVLMSIAGLACGELVNFPAVGQYDGSEQGNVVDRNAAFYAGNSSGTGDNPSLILKIESFRDEIITAFSNGCGGVVGFDNARIPGGTQADGFTVSFGEGKTLIVRSVDHIRTDFIAENICLPISGPGIETNGGFLAKSVVGDDRIIIRSSFNFSFEEQGFQSGEHVVAVAGTVLGRNGAAETSKWLMKVTLDNGDIIAQLADINFRTGNALDDTFFGARAPAGRHITAVTWINLDGIHSGLDGFAFMTNGRPPKPEPRPRKPSDHPTFFGIEYRGSSDDEDDTTAGDTTLFGTSRPN
jgi:hypothetical protein